MQIFYCFNFAVVDVVLKRPHTQYLAPDITCSNNDRTLKGLKKGKEEITEIVIHFKRLTFNIYYLKRKLTLFFKSLPLSFAVYNAQMIVSKIL